MVGMRTPTKEGFQTNVSDGMVSGDPNSGLPSNFDSSNMIRDVNEFQFERDFKGSSNEQFAAPVGRIS